MPLKHWSLLVTKPYPEDLAVLATQPPFQLEIPDAMRASIERQARDLIELASGLLHAGLDDPKVRAVITQAYSSYCEELISAFLSLRRSP